MFIDCRGLYMYTVYVDMRVCRLHATMHYTTASTHIMKAAVLFCCVLCWNYAFATVTDPSFYEYYKSDIAPAASLLDRQLPEGAASNLLQYPELRFEPNIDGLIRYAISEHDTYAKYIDRLRQLVDGYSFEKQATENLIGCETYSGYRPPDEWHKTCRVDPTFLLGRDSERCNEVNWFGFYDAEACILLSLDRVYNWVPEPYTNETVPDAIRDVWTPEMIPVTCEPGPDPVSIDNIDTIDVGPAGGLPMKFFPYIGQRTWLSPLVSVNVLSTPGVVVQVTCRAWAKNIVHRELLNTGSVTFDYMAD